MNPPEYLSVRFHFRGEFKHNGKEWLYEGGSTGMSTICMSKLSLPELKKHLADHVSCSAAFLEKTHLCWKLLDGSCRAAMIRLEDQASVRSMANYFTDVGVMDLYARHPSEEEFEEHDPTNSDNAVQNVEANDQTFRGSMEEKENKEQSLDEFSDSEDSDFLCVHDVDDSNSSAEDDEAISYRLQAKELKKKMKKKMLGDEEIKGCTVPEEFIVPEIEEEEDGEDEQFIDTEDELSYSEDSDGEVKTRKTKHRVYDENAEVREFELGQAFSDSRQFKQALINYGLKNFHHLLFPKDERTRVSAKCSWSGCPWNIYGSISGRSSWMIVTRFNNQHICVPRRDNKLVTSVVIAEKYFREIRDNPSWRVEKMQEAILTDMCADVSIAKCKRAKKLVMERIIDSTNGEFSRVFDYHLELVRSNPGSTVAVTLNPEVVDKPVFERMYVCLDGCKKGFMAGCRRVVGLDGCFLKGSVSGQLLCAVGRDANNQMYPIAWATVEVESYDSWYWFLTYLQKDIQVNNNGEGWVIISDQQKGLIKAVNEIVPKAEHRMCARHIYANWKKEHRDKKYQKMFWACAKSSNRTGFNYHRAKLAQHTPDGARDMMKTSPEHWSRAFFRLHNNCDSVENNLCESFNNAIMRARFYPVITQMEIIRKKMTARIQENRSKSQNWSGTICPNIFKKLKLNIKRSTICQVLWNGKDGFEVQEGEHRRFTVNLENMTCSCRYWELSGLPCCHAITAIYTVHHNLDEYIAPCYRISEYNRIYDHVLQPVEGKENWPVASNPRPFPPIKTKMPGRPKTQRRREEGEKPKGNKMSRKGCKIRCSACGGENHNKRKCTANPLAGEKEHANFTRAAKRSKKKQDKVVEEGIFYAQQAPDNAHGHATAHTSSASIQELGSGPIQVPAKKKSNKDTTAHAESSSQQAPVHAPVHANLESSSQPITTEKVPENGRLNWWFYGNQKYAANAGQGGQK